jgi:hypothetical protein
MLVDFDKNELDSLMHAVDTKLVLMTNEIAHTDSHEYRAYLKQIVSGLEDVQKKLGRYVPIPWHEHATVP